MEGTHRMLPARPRQPEPGRATSRAWTCSPQKYKVVGVQDLHAVGPGRQAGFFLDDDVGTAFIEKARKLGVRNIAVHKGLPFGERSYEHSTCVDVGRVAKRFPDMNFLIYHSGFVAEQAGRTVRRVAHRRHRRAVHEPRSPTASSPAANVYAELGSTWRFLMRDPDAAAHGIGKLLKYAGEDNVLWGTDSIWYGSPQDQIQAFRTFQISDALRRQARLSEDHAGAAREGLRPQRARACIRCRTPCCASTCRATA